MRLWITPKRWYRSYKLPGGQPRNPRWELRLPSRGSSFVPGNHFFFVFFTILSSPLRSSCVRFLLFLVPSWDRLSLLPPFRFVPPEFLSRPFRIFASVHQRSIHQNYNNNNDKSRNNVLCPREYIGRGPRGMGNGSAGRDSGRGRSSTCRPGAIIFFFRLFFWNVSPYRFSLNRRYPRDWDIRKPLWEGQRGGIQINNS